MKACVRLSVCQGVGEMVGVLTQRLTNKGTSLSEATEAISAILQLQADGAQSTLQLNPVELYITTLVRWRISSSSSFCFFGAPFFFHCENFCGRVHHLSGECSSKYRFHRLLE